MLQQQTLHTPKVSVVMPVYNIASDIERSIDCLLTQTLKDFQAIIIDDSSTDDTVEKIQKLVDGDGRFSIIKQAHQGPAVARNTGLQKATGETIIFLDGDDFFMPRLLEKTYRCYLRDHADVTIFGWRSFNRLTNRLSSGQQKEWPKEIQNVYSNYDLADRIFQLTINSPWTQLYSREYLINNSIRFDESVETCNDGFFSMLSLALAKKIVFVSDELLYYLYDRQGSISQKFSKHNITDNLNTLLRLKAKLDDSDIYQLYKKSFVNAFLGNTMYRLNRCDDETKMYFKIELKRVLNQDVFDINKESDDFLENNQHNDLYQYLLHYQPWQTHAKIILKKILAKI